MGARGAAGAQWVDSEGCSGCISMGAGAGAYWVRLGLGCKMWVQFRHFRVHAPKVYGPNFLGAIAFWVAEWQNRRGHDELLWVHPGLCFGFGGKTVLFHPSLGFGFCSIVGCVFVCLFVDLCVFLRNSFMRVKVCGVWCCLVDRLSIWKEEKQQTAEAVIRSCFSCAVSLSDSWQLDYLCSSVSASEQAWIERIA